MHREIGKSSSQTSQFHRKIKCGLDRRAWVYVHQDEALEMLIVRHLKSISVNFINHLENEGSWLMEVSLMRALTRYVTGASRAFGRKWSVQTEESYLGLCNFSIGILGSVRRWRACCMSCVRHVFSV